VRRTTILPKWPEHQKRILYYPLQIRLLQKILFYQSQTAIFVFPLL
jgi:hypothetical protein